MNVPIDMENTQSPSMDPAEGCNSLDNEDPMESASTNQFEDIKMPESPMEIAKAAVYQAQKTVEELQREAKMRGNQAQVALDLVFVVKQQAERFPWSSAFTKAAKKAADIGAHALQASADAKYEHHCAQKDFDEKMATYRETLQPSSAEETMSMDPKDAVEVETDISEDGAVIDDDTVHGGSLDEEEDQNDVASGQQSYHKTRNADTSMPPMEDEARKARDALDKVLAPRKDNGRKLDPCLDSWTQVRLEAMHMLFCEFLTGDRVGWMAASEQIARLYRHGNNWARQLRKWC